MPFKGEDSKPPPPNLYTTSILVLVSAVVKLARISIVPTGRKVFRGFGRKLGPEWYTPDKRGVICGVELAFMSTTTSRKVAIEYSGVKGDKMASLFEYDVGAVDCGAQLDTMSQYPGTCST